MSEPAALILGASGTLGGAVAKALAERGWRLGLHAFRHPERCAPGRGDKGHKVYEADFRDADQVAALAKMFIQDFGRLDALVWAAGIVHDAPVMTMDEAKLREVLSVNLDAPFHLLKACARQFLKQRAGAVVLVSSHAGLSGRAGGAAYAMAQSGLLAFMKSLAREWGPSGVRVNAVVPPFVEQSAMGQAATPAFVETVRRKNVLKGDADAAGAVGTFVAGLLANATASGQVFTLDARIAG